MPVAGLAWPAPRVTHFIASISIIGWRLALLGVRRRADDPLRAGSDEAASHAGDPSRGGTLVILSVATSIDAFAIGLSLAMLSVQILYPAVVIGVVTGSLSLLGLLVGSRLGKVFGKRMEILGGLILIVIGIRVVISHLV